VKPTTRENDSHCAPRNRRPSQATTNMPVKKAIVTSATAGNCQRFWILANAYEKAGTTTAMAT
jgi:hypothetical protein